MPCVLQAELGAFYPLLVLRPLELEEPGAADLAGAAAVLPCLGALCSEAQLLVDMFVNYDCDLRAPNLYERTVQVGGAGVARGCELQVHFPSVLMPMSLRCVLNILTGARWVTFRSV